MEQPSREIVSELAAALQRRLRGPVSVPFQRGLARVAKMFGAMCPATERKLLAGIAQADPDLLCKIRRAMFGADVAACGEWNRKRPGVLSESGVRVAVTRANRIALIAAPN